MKYTLTFDCEVNIARVEIEFEPYKGYNYYDDMYIIFDKEFYFIVNNELIGIEFIPVTTDVYDWSHTGRGWKETATYVDHIIRGLLASTLTDKELDEIILVIRNKELIKIKDIDESLKKDLIKAIQKAMVEYQI